MSTLSPVGIAAPRLAQTAPLSPAQVDLRPAPGVTPGTPLFDALSSTSAELKSSLTSLSSVSPEMANDDSTLQFRTDAYDANMRAQNWLATSFDDMTTSPQISQTMKEADSKLEYANWKTVGQDFRSGDDIGVDVIGAMKDTMAAASMVQNLLGTNGTTPPTPPPAGLPENVLQALAGANNEAGASVALLNKVPARDADNPKYLSIRKDAYQHNMDAQGLLTPVIADTTLPADVVDQVNNASISLQYANWSTVGQDPETQKDVGVNIAEAVKQTQDAQAILDSVIANNATPGDGPNTTMPVPTDQPLPLDVPPTTNIPANGNGGGDGL